MWLKVYSVFMTILSITSFVSTGLSGFFDYAVLAETILEIMGLLGYAFQLASFNETFWRMVFPIFVLFDLFTAFYPNRGVKMTLMNLLVEVVLGLPMYVSLFRYGFRSSRLWKAD